MINITTRLRLQAPPRLSASQPTDHVPELFRSEGKLAAPVGMRADRSLVHTPMHAEFVPHAVQMRLALDRVGTEVDVGVVPGGFRHGLRLVLTFTASTVRVDRVRQ
jgi:hypothetical protein